MDDDSLSLWKGLIETLERLVVTSAPSMDVQKETKHALSRTLMALGSQMSLSTAPSDIPEPGRELPMVCEITGTIEGYFKADEGIPHIGTRYQVRVVTDLARTQAQVVSLECELKRAVRDRTPMHMVLPGISGHAQGRV